LHKGFYRLAVLDSEAIERLDAALGELLKAPELESENGKCAGNVQV
jgi:hypothetical protein